ncbi:MAG: 3-oxoacyl-ACP reductase, partial [Geminicoccaceae bacterium]|nr:3-oxoacyl-ACP reductase [Geminicoccaceae bacterium]
MSGKKVAVLTAAGSGMGAASARALAGRGHDVVILSSSGRGEALAEELGGIGLTASNQDAGA